MSFFDRTAKVKFIKYCKRKIIMISFSKVKAIINSLQLLDRRNKVAEVKWTKEQELAISEKGSNILVAAAAR